jgi:hypothetical protein
MAFIIDTTCLYSTVRNISGGSKKFGFLPPHGRELANNEEFTVFGDVRQAVIGARGSERSVARRDIMAFEAAISRGDLEIVQTPAPILQDVTTNAVKMLQLDNGSLAAVDPCWTQSISV